MTLAFAIASLLALVVVPDSARAQPVPVTDIENADGDSVLTVFEDGGFAGYGEFGTGTIPVEGMGTRLMWYPAKGAFRAGRLTSNRWDDVDIGNHSVAIGDNPLASGEGSTAMGTSAAATGEASTAMGFGTDATGEGSTAIGETPSAHGKGATAVGHNTTAQEHGSTAMGHETDATENFATAMGEFATASGAWSTAMGNHTVAATRASLSIGKFNDANRGNDDSDPSTGPLFVVGNGSDPSLGGNRSDALVLHQNGDLDITGELSEASDRRLKEQIQPLGAEVLDKLEDIRPVRFRFKDERTHPSDEQIGLIAQEVQAQFPELTSEGSSGYLSVSYSKFTAVLLKGLQEQQAQIQKQKEQIERLGGQDEQIAALQAEVEALKEERAQHAGWGPAAGGLLGLLLLGGGVVAVRRWRTPSAASLLILVGAGALFFGSAPVTAQTLSVQNGAALEVSNGGTWDLEGATMDFGAAGATARLHETTEGRVTGGLLTAVRDLNAPTEEDVAGLGAELSASADLGEVTVTRGHTVQSDGSGNESIARYYDIEPSQNNSGLDATLTQHYSGEELNGIAESDLEMFKSEDGGSTWTEEGVDGRDAQANTVTLGGIESFSRWTLGSEANPLPVELAGFEATRSEERVRLQWETASEENNAGFEVQRRRADASVGTWEEIGFVESEADGGTTDAPQTYRFADSELPFVADSLTYRLRQVDTDGSATLSDPVTVEMGAPEKLALHGAAPNPVRGQATLRYEVPEVSKVRIEVFDVMGRQVTTLVDRKQAAGRKTTAIDASGLSSGTYFVRLTAEGTTQTEQITVVR